MIFLLFKLNLLFPYFYLFLLFFLYFVVFYIYLIIIFSFYDIYPWGFALVQMYLKNEKKSKNIKKMTTIYKGERGGGIRGGERGLKG